MEITENESIFLQALSITSLLAELHNNKFLGSEYYRKLSFSNNSFKEILELSGIGNPATMQIFLYILLVVPKEIRNAVAHAICYYEQINGICYVTFRDIRDSSRHCEINMKTSNVDKIFEILQFEIMQYIKNNHML